MWELSRLTSRGGLSTRRIFTYALAALIAAFLWVLLVVPSTHAADATRNGASIMYNSGQYFDAGKAKSGDSVNLPVGSEYFTYIKTVSEQPLKQEANVIYFAPGSDPSTAADATYVAYDFSAKTFSNPHNSKQITVGVGDQLATSCAIQGVGWIVCSASVFLADGMDWVFHVLVGFIEVQPASVGDSRSDLYIAWNLIRGFANIAFIITFLIIIYSQLTSVGLSNYGIKKLLPRLIVAAILVNISYYICAIAIDLSNVLGYAVQNMFVQMRNGLFNIDDSTWSSSVVDWKSVTGFVLSGGTAGLALGVGVSSALLATGGTVAGAIFLLLPALLGLLLTVLVVLLILAARQAIIVILLIISPLAFVAYLLPNTEKWFDKWRELFMTMLIFFPAFSLVFGGAQLAGGVIIQNATSINMIILGMIVQIAPLVITPLLLRLSGTLLGRIGGLVNDPRKGLLDRTRNWANDRAEMHKQRGLGDGAALRKRNLLRNGARRLDNNNRYVKERTDNYSAMSDNRYNATSRHQEQHEIHHMTETAGKKIEQELDLHLQNKIRTTPSMLKAEIEVRVLTDETATAKAALDRIHEGLRAGKDATVRSGAAATSGTLSALLGRSETATRDLALTAISTQTAKRVQQNALSKALLENTQTIEGQHVREYAGSFDVDNGADSALTYAITQQREAVGKLINERTQLIKHFKLEGGDRQKLAVGIDVAARRDDGTSYTFKANDEYAREAALELQLQTGSYDDIEEIISLSGIDDTATTVNAKGVTMQGARSFRTTISDGIAKNGLASKGLFLGGQFINNVAKGEVSGQQGLDNGVVISILGGKFRDEDLANNDAGSIKRYLRVAQDFQNGIIPAGAIGKEADYAANIAKLQAAAKRILDPETDLDRNSSQATKDALAELRDQL